MGVAASQYSGLFPAERGVRSFASLQKAGVVGLKVDFLDHEAKEVIDLYQDILRDAADIS